MQPSESVEVTTHIKTEAIRITEIAPLPSQAQENASTEVGNAVATQMGVHDSASPRTSSPSTESALGESEGQGPDAPVTVEDHSTDSSMELAIGSNFECKTRFSEQRLAEVDMDARALFKSSVVHLMEGIQSASSKVIRRMRSRTKLSVRVKAVSESEARLWAVLDMKDLSDLERKQMREFAAGLTSEMYAPTAPQKIAEFLSRARSIEHAHADGTDRDAASSEVAETLTNAKRHALDMAAQELLPPHMQQVVNSCGADADANLLAETLRRVVERGRVLSEELSKSKEWKGLELRFCDESLLRTDDLPKAQEMPTTTDLLPVQDAVVTKIDFVKCIVSLHLSRDDCRADVEYNDQEQGDAIGESLMAAHRANREAARVHGEGVQHPRLRVGLTRRTAAAGKKTYVMNSIEAI